MSKRSAKPVGSKFWRVKYMLESEDGTHVRLEDTGVALPDGEEISLDQFVAGRLSEMYNRAGYEMVGRSNDFVYWHHTLGMVPRRTAKQMFEEITRGIELELGLTLIGGYHPAGSTDLEWIWDQVAEIELAHGEEMVEHLPDFDKEIGIGRPDQPSPERGFEFN